MSSANSHPDPRDAASRVAAAYDAVAESYDRAYATPWCAAENDVLFALLRRLGLERGRRVLDVGCGTGLALEHLRIAPGDYVGIDVSEGMLAVARRKFPDFPAHAFRRLDVAWLGQSYADDFDAALLLFGVLGYLPDPEASLRRVHEALLPGGVAVVLAYGPRHDERAPGMIRRLHSVVPCAVYSRRSLVELTGRVFDKVAPFGFNWGERVACRLPRWLQAGYLALETATVGRWRLDACRYVGVIARKKDRR